MSKKSKRTLKNNGDLTYEQIPNISWFIFLSFLVEPKFKFNLICLILKLQKNIAFI